MKHRTLIKPTSQTRPPLSFKLEVWGQEAVLSNPGTESGDPQHTHRDTEAHTLQKGRLRNVLLEVGVVVSGIQPFIPIGKGPQRPSNPVLKRFSTPAL